MAAFLWAKQSTAVSHASAARLHRFDKYREDDSVELISRQVMKPPKGITLHRARSLTVKQVCDLQGMKVTTVARTIFDLHASDAREGAKMLDEALRRRMVQIGELEFVATLNRGKGQAATPEFERLIEDRRVSGHADHDLETDVIAFLAKYGFPPHRRQFHITIPGRVTAQVDFAWPDQRVCLLAHGGTIHRQGKVWENDQTVENAIRGGGWEAVVVTRKILNQTPDNLAADLRTALSKTQNPGHGIEGLEAVRHKA
jgi:hypothetical protein